jgi:hypothetical protein
MKNSSLVQLFLDPKLGSYKYECKPWVYFQEKEVVILLVHIVIPT